MSHVYGNCTLPIEQLLLQWQMVLGEATARMSPYLDLPYWYNEKANVGYLAQAASQLGLAVVEEATVNRGKRKGAHPGRADLWIGDFSRSEHEFEFKLYWPSIKSNDQTFARNVKQRLSDTQGQLRAIQDKPGRYPSKVAMAFVCPSIAERDQGWWKELLDCFVNRVTRPQDYGGEFSAVFAPPTHMQGPEHRKADDGYLYPAIAVFGKMV